jgi:hypothetical protein
VMVETTMRDGFEWAGDSHQAVERDSRGWPILRPSRSGPCDGLNPLTGRGCLLGDHQGYHRDDSGAEWLDEE